MCQESGPGSRVHVAGGTPANTDELVLVSRHGYVRTVTDELRLLLAAAAHRAEVEGNPGGVTEQFQAILLASSTLPTAASPIVPPSASPSGTATPVLDPATADDAEGPARRARTLPTAGAVQWWSYAANAGPEP